MKVRVDEELAEDCKCELKVLAIKNSLAKGVLRVTVLETRTGIILEGIEIRQIEDDLYSHEGDLQVHFSNYDDFAVVGNHRRCGLARYDHRRAWPGVRQFERRYGAFVVQNLRWQQSGFQV
jgi:hypothetical protein